MKHIKKINEDLKSNEQKARDAGYEVGDTVHNRKMGKDLTIISDGDYEKNGVNKDTCTLGAVGQFLDNYHRSARGIKSLMSGNKRSDDLVNNRYQEVISLMRSPKFQKMSDDEYLALMMKLKKWFKDNVIE